MGSCMQSHHWKEETRACSSNKKKVFESQVVMWSSACFNLPSLNRLSMSEGLRPFQMYPRYVLYICWMHDIIEYGTERGSVLRGGDCFFKLDVNGRVSDIYLQSFYESLGPNRIHLAFAVSYASSHGKLPAIHKPVPCRQLHLTWVRRWAIPQVGLAKHFSLIIA